MMVVDTSALIAILKSEEMAYACERRLAREPQAIISAGTLVEAHIVSLRAGRSSDLEEMVAASVSEVIPVTDERARFVSEVYWKWGKGFHPTSLNFGDCFAYATAKEFDCPLLYVGQDFSRTDIQPALAAT
ncbi:ribonuclease VapC [Pseudorhizobium tarimense]|uniref:Ribonuclease VapC n=1 Tax=Pseudorhizobium tarimense TaxID=1079109 RepID=A0ABV2HD23_9HYPH|nr:type II toxin-antitoxin system VapC family toxin [Pseudorhizobium tarimense]MCJ8521404.1 type II toxin-antitoxin system VapC family toxin [Pseudorhizobium tarimense]